MQIKIPTFPEHWSSRRFRQENEFIQGAWSKEMDMVFVRHIIPRIHKDHPEWKLYSDKPKERGETQNQWSI